MERERQEQNREHSKSCRVDRHCDQRWNNSGTFTVYYYLMGYQFFRHSGTTLAARSRVDLLVLLLFLVAHAAIASANDRVDTGKTLAMDRGKGNCLACHMIDDGLLPGDLGPPLLAMKLRFPDRDLLKIQICDASLRNANSRMPPFCRHGILTEDEVELIMDYLYTL